MLKSIAKSLIRKTYGLGLPYINSRAEFPFILNARGILGEGVEVGVHRGDFSKLILDSWQGSKLYSVDPWLEFGEDYIDQCNVKQDSQDKLYRETVAKLAPFGKRSEIQRTTSKEAAAKFKDAQLDFVYLDAQHQYEAIKQDIDWWWPKVKNGGLLAGHDYLDDTRAAGEYGIKSAVDEFVRKAELVLRITKEDNWRSWLVFK